jgi:hypothetical protein
MRATIGILCSVLLFSLSLSAQQKKIILISAGTRMIDYFPVKERYRYQDFIDGQVRFKSGKSSEAKLNYNILLGEMEFIQDNDTLSIARKKDLKYITVAQDTFYYYNGYIESLSGGDIKVGLLQCIMIKDVLKKGAYGTTARGASVDTYDSMMAGGLSYDLVPNADIELQRIMEYYLWTYSTGFMQYSKKNVLKLFPGKIDIIKDYLKSNKINFESKDDLLRLTTYLRTL